MADRFQEIIGDEHPTTIARGKALKHKRLEITDSLHRKTYPLYILIDPMLLNPHTLILFLPNRAYLVEGSNLEPMAKRFLDEAITSLQPYGTTPANEPGINSITMHWFYDKTPEEFLKEIMAAEEAKKPVLEPVH